MDEPRGYIFVADAHLTDLDEDSRAFISMLDRARREKIEIFLLGDIFDLWFGKEKLTYPFQKKLLDEIDSLSKSGLMVNYIEGNRDFFIVNSWAGKLFKRVEETKMKIDAGGKEILLLHGDMVNRADIQYRFFRALSKNWIVYSIFSIIPGKVALAVAASMEKTLKSTNRRFKYSFPEKESRAFAEVQFGKGIDMVILGHFHRERLIPSPGKESIKLLVCLPMWREMRRYFFVGPSGDFGFKNFEEEKPLI